MSTSENLINPFRKRTLPKYYSWIDHKLVHDGYLRKITSEASALYLFLLTVGDRDGMSYYSDKAIVQRLNLVDIKAVRDELISMDLLVYRQPFYQLLSLPKDKVELAKKRIKAPASEAFVRDLMDDYLRGQS